MANSIRGQGDRNIPSGDREVKAGTNNSTIASPDTIRGFNLRRHGPAGKQGRAEIIRRKDAVVRAWEVVVSS